MNGAVKFLPNRVWRVYSGGSGIDRLRGEKNGQDGHFPEDWIASTSLANNPQYDKPGQGLSQVALPGGAKLFSEYLAENPEYTLGKEHFSRYGANAALLMKILDAAEQLPIQCHPSVPDARRYYNSDFGKTEAWYIADVREVNGVEPYLLVGFNDKLDVEQFKREALSGAFPTGEQMLHKLKVKPGDCLLIRGGLPHAIGSGVTLIEIMEPSDLVIQPEHFCGTQKLSEAERWTGAVPEDALKCFDYTSVTAQENLRRNKFLPEQIDEHLQMLIPRTVANYFELQKLVCCSHYKLYNTQHCHRAGVVTAGNFMCSSGDEKLELHCGDAFFLPYGLTECDFYGDGEIVFALPPEL